MKNTAMYARRSITRIINTGKIHLMPKAAKKKQS